ncbi:hypothetical protein IQ264_07570 [Phormidium sp. LEGE 05292]|uniref:hypothetical protein n=1 Tax=[Phormidium] sp. LEGE 05292 TaxID=767427 RepID=UPI001882582F|nr:hypothetical protein [Phormidium sp. LEGE 05292]MBE9225290.1 hypothetical protein [Phormidium sp. LEGE 05292]
MTIISDLPNLKLKGPFWTAEAETIWLEGPEEGSKDDQWALRSLFVQLVDNGAVAPGMLYLPGTIIALCFIKTVEIKPVSGTSYLWQRPGNQQAPKKPNLAEIQAKVRSGELALLLLVGEASEWTRSKPPQFTCIAGEISLTPLRSQQDAQARLYNVLDLKPTEFKPNERSGNAGLVAELSVHSSGLTIYGKARLPWLTSHRQEQPRLAAPFQLAIELPLKSTPQLRLSLETERLTPAEENEWIKAWQQFSYFINPSYTFNEFKASAAPSWVTIEVSNSSVVPSLYWRVFDWSDRTEAQPLPLQFPSDAVRLSIADQNPYNPKNPPTSLARTALEIKSITSQENQLIVRIGMQQNDPVIEQGTLTYNAEFQAEQPDWNESFTVDDFKLAFHPTQTPSFLRNNQDLLIPEWFYNSTLFRFELSQAELNSLDSEILPENFKQLLEKSGIQPKLDSKIVTIQQGKWWLFQATTMQFEDKITSYFIKLEPETIQLEKKVLLISRQPNAINPAVLWGFMPLAEGWAQLPVPNITEQIYLDAQLANVTDPTASQTQLRSPLFQGAVEFGNRNVEIPQPESSDEHPWSFSLLDAESLSGTWTLHRQEKEAVSEYDDYQLKKIELTLKTPEIILDGLFWLSTGKPKAEDALPDLNNWISGVESIPLQTVLGAQDTFPPLVAIAFKNLRFYRKLASASESIPVLGEWSFQYEVDSQQFYRAVQRGVLPPNTFSDHLALVWRRHSTLPMIQALPLTQSKTPANFPNASRQLMPFELNIQAETHLPNAWRFGVGLSEGSDRNLIKGARNWASVLNQELAPAREWRSLFDLPMVSLSVPGLILDPNPNITKADIDAETKLNRQYRFDLPYTDELNAFAQLPKVPKNPEVVSPLPDSPPPEPPKPLTRESLADHWQSLSDRANLASADAVDAFVSQADRISIQHLIEPFSWNIKPPQFQLDSYPGKFELTNADDDNNLTIQTDRLLEGISGHFVESNGTLKLIKDGSQNGKVPYTITAGSMETYQLSNSDLRDQRGLSRAVSQATALFISTPVQVADAGTSEQPVITKTYELTTSLVPVDLQVHEGRNWQIWFRDIPFQEGVFERQKNLSPFAEDINDPEALSRDRNYLAGYEWRLAANDKSSLPLELFNLHFYPLTLEYGVKNGDRITQIEIIGRLQLPITNPSEIENLNTVVRLKFSLPNETSNQLELAEISLEPLLAGNQEPTEAPVVSPEKPKGKWYLTSIKSIKEETGEVPCLEWQHIELNKTNKTINISEATLKFSLFNTIWSIPLRQGEENITLSFGETAQIISVPLSNFNTLLNSELTAAGTLFLKVVDLSLDLRDIAQPKHEVSVTIAVQLGQRYQELSSTSIRSTYSFKADIKFALLQDSYPRIVWENATLFDDLEILTSSNLDAIVARDNSLQFRWEQYQLKSQADEQSSSPRYLLPGMVLKSGQAPGYATLTFTIQQETESLESDSAPFGTAKLHTIKVQTVAVEALLFCQWGDFIQSDLTPEFIESNQLFSSSAGDVIFGYTGELKQVWQESLLLNGFVEIKNLISWSTEMKVSDNKTSLTYPAARPKDGLSPDLNHIRHTMRILFNQHQIPSNLLGAGNGEFLLFNLKTTESWKFLAVVEHQLINVKPLLNRETDEWSTAALENDRRWTVVQEVRLFSPNFFRKFLESLSGAKTLSPTGVIADLQDATHGYLSVRLRSLLATGANPDLAKLSADTLLVEASAPHWIKQQASTVSNFTSLQFLPNGTQQAILSNLRDYAPSAPTEPKWLLLIMPFLGRLQAQVRDRLDASLNLENLSALQLDPIQLLQYRQKNQRNAPISDIVLALCHWADFKPLEVGISGFETTIGRTWSRLDPLSVEESWFRFQNPPRELLPTDRSSTLQSVTAALPDTPARLSRSTALNRAFDAVRLFYPPQSNSSSSAIPATSQIVPQPKVLLLNQGNGWTVTTGLQIIDNCNFPKKDTTSSQQPTTTSQQTNRYPAATLLSTSIKNNPVPLSLAISPYLGLGFSSVAQDTELRLTLAELLCLDKATQTLKPVASHTWELQKFELDVTLRPELDKPTVSDELAKAFKAALTVNPVDMRNATIEPLEPQPVSHWKITINSPLRRTYSIQKVDELASKQFKLLVYQGREEIRELSNSWAEQTHALLAPDSPVAILRFREINEGFLAAGSSLVVQDSTAPALSTTYSFAIAPSITPILPVKRVFPMRSPVRWLRFREAQFNLNPIPVNLRSFELASPQTTSVQPLYLLPNSKLGEKRHWAWGMSGLCLSVQYTEKRQAIAGKPIISKSEFTLWWQAFQHFVQFRSAANSPKNLQQATAGLPPMFRAPAIKSLLPALPDPLLPTIDEIEEKTSFDLASINPFKQGQPVLPGNVYYLMLGNRPGTMLAIRNQLLRQSYSQTNSHAVMVSGSIPVQHRMPRPVPLPENQNTNGKELQTWASYFEPNLNVLATNTPADEAFFAEFLPQEPEKPKQVARRLRMQLKAPEYGAILYNWDGILVFEIETKPEDFVIEDWTIKLSITTTEQPIEYTIEPIFSIKADSTDEAQKAQLQKFAESLNSLIVEDELIKQFETQGIILANATVLVKQSDRLWRITDNKQEYVILKRTLKAQIDGQDSQELNVYHYRHRTYHFKPLNEQMDLTLKSLLTQKAGSLVTAQIRIRHKSEDSFEQILSFPLRIAGKTALPYAVEPYFIHFEDPEYNRLLSSPSARTNRTVTIKRDENEKPEIHTITLATDRRDYNFDSLIALRYDWDNKQKFQNTKAKLEFYAISNNSAETRLQIYNENGLKESIEFSPGQLHQLSLQQLQRGQKIGLAPGENLELRLTIEEILNQEYLLKHKVNIVEIPVNPVPQAAYALLRGYSTRENSQVECVRFAWSPEPNRIELVCAEDLRTEVVRRRAVFHWQDSMRVQLSQQNGEVTEGETTKAERQWLTKVLPIYQIQKFTQTGSTHFPKFKN